MRRILFAISLCALVLPTFACSADADDHNGNSGTSAAAPSATGKSEAGGDNGTIEVVATHGPEKYAAAGLVVGVTSCQAGSAPTTLTTGRDGHVHQDFAADCYQVQVTSVPMGCRLGTETVRQVDVVAGGTATAEFGLTCA
ncbi:hypothetical protein AB0L57_24855 [Nocardia sp. NPDC052254]|uniref:hypothetical protein n=1 Tax=Nocardia sp. NPDC052254 TaxID=3155681 RepID=UPI003434BCA4